ncbi:unnamed protein product [Fusarium graminearum]|nr:unnamed protein product [Fusarium graminearum]
MRPGLVPDGWNHDFPFDRSFRETKIHGRIPLHILYVLLSFHKLCLRMWHDSCNAKIETKSVRSACLIRTNNVSKDPVREP